MLLCSGVVVEVSVVPLNVVSDEFGLKVLVRSEGMFVADTFLTKCLTLLILEERIFVRSVERLYGGQWKAGRSEIEGVLIGGVNLRKVTKEGGGIGVG